ncbi:hypothetical protein IE53DRAFT_385877 [Violaceomyces palustris]|uniref:Uncharacterized protein n=1 Tax=Violaceomyces palustris TaxID=1673888 RepID=A0ACD0P0Y1_9BASI|nr:hypothetical protein IE53DRAFT_385877 [Violaceomyces palustris]
MASATVPISTPSRPKKVSSSANSTHAAAFSPGGKVPEGFSYLTRSTSMSTSSRSKPRGLQHQDRQSLQSPKSAINSPPTLPSPKDMFDELPLRSSKSVHSLATTISTGKTLAGLTRSTSESHRLAHQVAQLPKNPKQWTPSQVALYLSHVLGLVPKPIVEDVTAYVRTSRMGGRTFLRLSDKDLEQQGLNTKWRKLMIEAVRKLRRDALKGRIWGFAGGSLDWPRTADEAQDDQPAEKDQIQERDADSNLVRSSKGVSKLTLKRMRDSKKVKGMIEAFETAPEETETSEDGFVALGLLNARSPSSSGDNCPITDSPRPPLPPIYGEGFVRGRAGSFDQLADAAKSPTRQLRSMSMDLTEEKDEIEILLSSLSEQEAEELACELDEDDLKDPDLQLSMSPDVANVKRKTCSSFPIVDEVEVSMVPTLSRYQRRRSNEYSGESLASSISTTAESDCENNGPPSPVLLLTPIDADIIRAIMEESDIEPDPFQDLTASGANGLTRSKSYGARPERPYRASTYTEEEIHMLGLGQGMDSDHIADPQFDTARKMVHAMDAELEPLPEPVRLTLGINAESTGTAKRMSSEFVESSKRISAAASVHDIFGPPSSDKVPIMHTAELISQVPVPVKRTLSKATLSGAKGTFGSKRGKRLIEKLSSEGQGTNSLFASLPSRTSGNTKKGALTRSTDEEGWGGTLGRKSAASAATIVPTSNPSLKGHMPRVASEAEGEKMAEADDITPKNTEESGVQIEDNMIPATSAEARLLSFFQPAEAEHEQMAMFLEPAEKEEDVGMEALVATAEKGVGEEKLKEENFASSEVHDGADRQEDGQGLPDLENPDLTKIESEASNPSDFDECEERTGASTEAVQELMKQDSPGETQAESAEETVHLVSMTDSHIRESSQTRPKAEDILETDSDGSSASVAEVAESSATTAAEGSGLFAEPSLDESPAAIVPIIDIDEPQDDLPIPNANQLLVPLTTVEPHPSGKGSVRKRSMVLVDRQRFESLARRMQRLEDQLNDIELNGLINLANSKQGTVEGSRSRRSKLEELFKAEMEKEESDLEGGEGEQEEGRPSDEEAHQESPTSLQELEKNEEVRPSRWSLAAFLASLTPFSLTSSGTKINRMVEEEKDPRCSHPPLGARLDDAVDPQEVDQIDAKGNLTLGAIPAYMLGLSAGVGFVVVREVISKSLGKK